MANKKQVDTNKEVLEKKKPTKKTTTTKKSTTSTTKKTNSNTVKKTTSNKSNSKTINKTIGTKKTTTKSVPKKNTQKKTVTKDIRTKTTVDIKKNEEKEEVVVKDVELAKVNEKIELEDNNKDILKLEDAKYPKKKDKKLLAVGIFVILLGIIALFISLVANRIVDREFLSDNAITLMMVASIIIEGFGAFIIINES